MIVTKDIDRKVYGYKDPWEKILASVAWAIRRYCHSTLGFTPGEDVVGKSLLFNFTSILYWRVVTAMKQR